MSKKVISSEPIYYGLNKLVPKNRFLKVYSIIISVILVLILLASAAFGAWLLIFRTLSPSEIIEKNVSAVVAIQTYYFDENGSPVVGTGSGFVVDGAGYIVTNEHVVDDGGAVYAYLLDGNGGRKEYSARIVALNGYYDVAVLKIHSEDENYCFPTVKLGRADNLTVGEQVVAIGTPQEIAYAWTSTVGRVTSNIRNFLENGSIEAKPYIQFDAAVNAGNSGGPLFDSKGRVVGIVEKKVIDQKSGESLEGMGLAIPIETVTDLINSFIKEDKEKTQIGIVGLSVKKGQEYFLFEDGIYEIKKSPDSDTKYFENNYFKYEFTDDIAETGEVFVADATGFMIESVSPGTGAYGIFEVGDIIVGFDGLEMIFNENTSPYDVIIGALATKKAGDIVEVTFVRDGEAMSANVKLTPKK